MDPNPDLQTLSVRSSEPITLSSVMFFPEILRFYFCSHESKMLA